MLLAFSISCSSGGNKNESTLESTDVRKQTSQKDIGKVGVVTNPATGRTWMDRNLGASRVATGNTDAEAYGDLYQWGRAADGHQKETHQLSQRRAVLINRNMVALFFLVIPLAFLIGAALKTTICGRVLTEPTTRVPRDSEFPPMKNGNRR